MQVSSRELAGQRLSGYEKRDITYEVHATYLAKLFNANMMLKNLSHEDVKKVCRLLAFVSSELMFLANKRMLTCPDDRY